MLRVVVSVVMVVMVTALVEPHRRGRARGHAHAVMHYFSERGEEEAKRDEDEPIKPGRRAELDWHAPGCRRTPRDG